MSYDTAIIGGGIVGCAIAYELTQYQLRVLLIEKAADLGWGASKANSGIIHAGQHSPRGTLKGALEWEGNQRWAALHETLDFGYRRTGELTVAIEAQHIATLEQLQQQGAERGVPGLEIWDQQQVRHEEPILTPDLVAALHAPTAAVINPYEACFRLAAAARQRGLELALEQRVEKIVAHDDGLTVVTDRASFEARFVINAAGLYADEVAALAGVNTFTIQPRKGEEYLLDKRLAGIISRIIFPCPTPTSKGILIIPTVDGTIMVGPTAHEVDSKTDTSTTASGSEEVFTSVRRLIPGISERDCIAEFAGLRAVTKGDDFIIGTTAQPGFINVAGIQSPGLTAAPAIAHYVADLLRHEGLPLHPNPRARIAVSPRPRFASLPTEAQKALVAQDRRYSHIICRCEQVSEREILDAIEDGARTLDSLKLRTRAGMGRCQGGFCTWRCMELLARAHGLPMTAMTKHGGESWLICPREEKINV
jgi:glycerol-3-phosphate dehydrogenase